jgi:hypothetical protein
MLCPLTDEAHFCKILRYQISPKSVYLFLSFMHVDRQNNFHKSSTGLCAHKKLLYPIH